MGLERKPLLRSLRVACSPRAGTRARRRLLPSRPCSGAGKGSARPGARPRQSSRVVPLGAAALPRDALLVPLQEARWLSPGALPRPAALPWQGMTLGQRAPLCPLGGVEVARPGQTGGRSRWLWFLAQLRRLLLLTRGCLCVAGGAWTSTPSLTFAVLRGVTTRAQPVPWQSCSAFAYAVVFAQACCAGRSRGLRFGGERRALFSSLS